VVKRKPVDDFGYVKTWVRKTCKVCRSEDMRQQRIQNPDKFRGYEYKKKYKINLDTYNKKLEEQVEFVPSVKELGQRF
jgi:hypothetical protein